MVFGVILAYLAVPALIAVGWILNILALVHTHALDGLTIARGIGVFVAPLGSVLGYFA